MTSDTAVTTSTRRSPIRGVLQIVQFNWPQYAVGFAAIAAAVLILVTLPIPPVAAWILRVGVALAAWWLCASLFASYWIYDLSPLTQWKWLERYLPSQAGVVSVLNIHSGFDDTTTRLRDVFPRAHVQPLDLYDPARMTEPSIHRARRALPPLAETIVGTPDSLPVANKASDVMLLLLAAHELRKPCDREALFCELHRALAPRGRIVIVEHARDAANFLAFGPGFLHFLPYGEWLRLARAANLRTICEGRVTPFVRFLVLEK